MDQIAGAVSLMDYVNQFHDDMRTGLVQKITNESIFMRILKFLPIDGLSYTYGEQATLGGIAFRGLNEVYDADTGMVNPKTESLAILGGVVETDHQLVLARGGGARASALAAKVRKAGLFFDKYVIDGDPAVNAKQFYGLNARITGNQLLTVATNGGAMTLALVDRLIDAVAGLNEQKVLVMNKSCRRKLKSLIQAAAGGAGLTDIGGSLKTYDGVPIEVMDEDGDEAPILAYDETTGNSAVTASIYCVRPGQDTEGEYMQGLIGSKAIEHYESGMNKNMHVDVVEAKAGIAVFHGRAAARLKGITDA